MTENEISLIVVREATAIHKAVGPGLLEKVYVECLFHRLCENNLQVEKEKPIPVVFEKVKMDCGYRADLFVQNKVVVEVKAIEAIADVHKAVLLTYLKFARCKLGILINFNELLLKNGIRRVVNGL